MPGPTKRIAFVSEKGGTGKTTLSVNLAAHLARGGQRVLLVDLDTQGHAGKSLGLDVREISPTLREWLLDPALPLSQVVHPTSTANLSVLPSNKTLADYPIEVAADAERELRLLRRLQEAEGHYDVVVIDSPPSAGLFISSAILAATHVVLPVGASYLALDGCAEIVDTIARLKARHGRTDPEIAMVVPTLYRRTALADEIVAKVRSYFPEQAARTVLGQSVHIDEAQSHGKTVFDYAPRSKGTEMLRQLGDELAGRLGLRLSKTGKVRKKAA